MFHNLVLFFSLVETLDIFLHLAVARLLVPEETLGAGGQHRHAPDADVVLAAVLRMWHVTLFGGGTREGGGDGGTGFGPRRNWYSDGRHLRGLRIREQLLKSGESTGSHNIADGNRCSTAWRCAAHNNLHLLHGILVLGMAIANGLIAQLTLGHLVIPSSATPTLVTMQMAVGADEVQPAVARMGQEVGAKVPAFDILWIVLLHGINLLPAIHINGHENRTRLMGPPLQF